jgi:hypothetical protein
MATRRWRAQGAGGRLGYALLGDVAEWLRSGLQSRVHRFDSGRRLSLAARPRSAAWAPAAGSHPARSPGAVAVTIHVDAGARTPPGPS